MGAKDRLRAAAVAGLLLTGFPSAFAQNWALTSAPITNWSSIAMSADGSKLVGVAGDYPVSAPILYSTNGGTDWTVADAPLGPWACVATSADGAKWIAAARYARYGVYLSTNCAANWTLSTITDSNNAWISVRSSADGETLAAADYGTGPHFPTRLFVSTNAGKAWSESYAHWAIRITALATSADGADWFAAGESWDGSGTSSVLTSSNRALTWMNTVAPYVGWTSIAASANGKYCVGASDTSGVYVSTNSGMGWTVRSVPYTTWVGVASSADGSKLAAVPNSGFIQVSTDFGMSWSPAGGPSTNWSSVASSADGCKLAAVVNGGGIYIWQTTPSPQLNIAPTVGGLRISWIVPSMSFVLQENSDLTTTNWTDVPTLPSLNFTNLHHEITVPLSTTNRFYRLQRLLYRHHVKLPPRQSPTMRVTHAASELDGFGKVHPHFLGRVSIRTESDGHTVLMSQR